jgi:hypothetical protein
MKVTIDIDDALLVEAQEIASRDNTTVSALVEQGLLEIIAERAGGSSSGPGSAAGLGDSSELP